MPRTSHVHAPRVRTRAILLSLTALIGFAACSDEGPGGVKPPEPPATPELQASVLLCTANTGTRTVSCAPADAGLNAADAAWRSISTARGGLWTASSRMPVGDTSVIIGGQGVNVTLTGTNVVFAGGEFTFDVTIKNHIGQPLGTTDGTTLHPMGVRVFFDQLPMETSGGGGGPYTVAGDGTATFTAADQPYYQFDEIIGDEQTSGPVQFKFTGLPADITFGFRVLVWAPVQWPDGWVAITPAGDTLNLAVPAEQSTTLTGTVYSRVGVVMAEAITWGSSDPGVATVDGNGLVTAVAWGSTIITASATGRADGAAAITVFQPADTSLSEVTTTSSTLTADGASTTTVTVQLKDGLGNNLNHNAGTVALSNSGAGSLGAVTYAGSGSYTATLTAPSVAGADTIFATLDATPLAWPATVEYTPGIPTALIVEASDSTPDANAAITVTAQLVDANNNFVKTAGVSVAWSATNGGSFAASPTNTDADGIATAQFTVSGIGGYGHGVTADAGGGLTGVVSINVNNVAPVGGADSYNGIGNVTLSVAAADGLLANDVTIDGGAIGAVAAVVATSQGGSAMIATDGSFNYLPRAGFTGGNDTFQYAVIDQGGMADTVAVTIAVSGIYWFVDVAGTGAGTQADPAATLAIAVDSAEAGDTILVATGTYAGVTLENGQVVRGASLDSAMVRTLNAVPVQLLAVGARPTINSTVTLGTNNTLRSINIAAAAGNGITGNFGTLILRDMNVSAAGAALDLANGALDAVLGTLSGSGSGANALTLTNVTGSLTATGGALSGGSAATLRIHQGTLNLTYPGTITGGANYGAHISSRTAGTITLSGNITTSTAGILVENNTGGTVDFSGAAKNITVTGANEGVRLNNNAASTNFTSGGLHINSASGNAFSATSGGTISVTGAGNWSRTASASALNIQNTTVHTNNIVFDSLRQTAGTVAGISLGNLSGTGSITVSGNGSAGTGGGLSSTSTVVSLLNMNSVPVTLNYLNIASATGLTEGIVGSAFGTLNLTGVAVNTTTGRTLTLGTGTLNGTANTLTNSGAGNAVLLQSVGGTFAAGGTLSGAFRVNGGGVGVTYAGSLSNTTGASPLVLVDGGHNGTVTFNTGTLSDNAGTGLQFDNADGTYNFNGTTTLNGGDAGIDITNGSGGAFTFGSNTSITHSQAGNQAFFSSGSTANVTYSGNISKSSAGWLVDVFNQSGGTITFQTGTLSATGGDGILANNADGTLNFNGTTTLNGGNARVVVSNGSTGTISLGTGASVTNPTSEALNVSSSAPNFTYNGRIVKTNGGTGISVTSNTGGTVNLGSRLKQLSSTTSTAVNLTSNSGTVTSGDSLQITTTSGTGYNATGSGTVNVQGAWNTVSSGTGTAVNINAVTIGSSGVTWRSVSHSGGANGISLVSTGNSGGSFTVTGDGSTNSSGGTITNTTGGDGATGGNGIYLSNTRNISLNWMALSGHANNGLFGTGVRGNLTVNKVRFTGNNGTSNSGTFDESVIQLVNHGGATRITNSRLDGAAWNAVRVENNTGTAPAIDSLVIENDTVSTMQGSTADVRSSAIQVSLSDGTGDVRIRNNRVLVWWGNAVNVAIQGTASGTSRITGNFADNTNGALAGAGGIWVAGGAHSFNISGNTVRHTNGTAISVDRVNFGSTMQGTVDNNAIGVSGDPNSGTVQGAAIFAGHHGPGTTTVKISNNVIRQAQAGSGNGAIWLLTGDALGFGGSGTFNATVSANNIQESSAPLINAHNGILATIGTQSGPPTDTDQVCLDIVSNTIANFNSNTNRIRINARFGTTTRFPGYTDVATGAASATAIGAYMQGRNTITQSNSANSSTSGFFNTVPAGSACPQPSM